MLVHVEPKGLTMFAVFLVFNTAEPDDEDAAVRAYLRDEGLVPKRAWEQEWQGAPCQVLYFGGCYLQPHMGRIRELHERGVKRALLARQIERALTQRPSLAVREAVGGLPPGALEATKAALLEACLVESSFGADRHGYLAVTLPIREVRRRFLALARERYQPRTRGTSQSTTASGKKRASRVPNHASRPTE